MSTRNADAKEAAELSGLGRRRVNAKVTGDEHYSLRRAKIIRAAAAVMQEKGLQGTTIRDIANESGFDRATIYYYFRDKSDIVREAMRGALTDLVLGVEQLGERNLPAPQRLHAAIRLSMETYERHYPYLYLYFEESGYVSSLSPDLAKELNNLGHRYELMLRETIKGGVEAGEFSTPLTESVVASLILGMLNWTYRWYQPRGELTAGQIADGMWQLVSKGLGRSAQGRRKSNQL